MIRQVTFGFLISMMSSCNLCMALNGLLCVDIPLRTYKHTLAVGLAQPSQKMNHVCIWGQNDYLVSVITTHEYEVEMSAVSFLSLSLCLCLSCCWSSFWKPWRKNFMFGMQVHLQNIYVKFISSWRSYIKVIRSKSRSREQKGIYQRNKIHTFVGGLPLINRQACFDWILVKSLWSHNYKYIHEIYLFKILRCYMIACLRTPNQRANRFCCH